MEHSSHRIADIPVVTCPLCRRRLDGKVTRHHLYPQKYGKKRKYKAHAKAFPVMPLHKICHRMIHAFFSEKYLAQHLNTIEALRAHPAMQSFLAFIEEKPPSFDVRVRRNKNKRQRDKPDFTETLSQRPLPPRSS